MRPTPAIASPTNPPGLTRGLILLLALVCGAAVSNIAYIQPLLEQIRQDLHVTAAGVGLASTLTQVGYTLGLLFLVPLGDISRRRRVILTLVAVEALFLISCAVAPSLFWLQLASFGIGLASVSAQLIVPLVAQLSTPEKRGQNVGTVMSGLLLGVLLSRFVAGAVGGTFGWRATFWLAFAVSLVLLAVLARALPDVPPATSLKLGQVMKSLWDLTRSERELRESALVGGLNFAAFMAFWTSLAFHLEGPAYHFSAQTVGLFGLLGAAGALAAPLVGRRADKVGPRAIIGFSTLMVALSFAVMGLFGAALIPLILGVLWLDANIQGTHISNQSRIFALLPEARSRLNTVYMVACFSGGSLGSLLSIWAWTHWGWSGVSAVGFGLALAAHGVHRWYHGNPMGQATPTAETAAVPSGQNVLAPSTCQSSP